MVKRCAWCKGPIPVGARRDAKTCSKSCRQARWRWLNTVGVCPESPVVVGHERRIAYADPPYPGKSKRYYGEHVDYAGEVDHRALLESLAAENDTWALSTSTEALLQVGALAQAIDPSARVAAWVRGYRVHKDSPFPLRSWEPVIYGGQIASRRSSTNDASSAAAAEHDASSGSERPVEEDLGDVSWHADGARRVDSLVHGVTARTTDPERVTGAKPALFCRWLFDLLDARPGDVFVDVFPGSGGVARAWESYASPHTAVLLDA